MKTWKDGVFSEDKRYHVNICSMDGVLFRSEVAISYNGGETYRELTCGDWSDEAGAKRSYRRYIRKYIKGGGN